MSLSLTDLDAYRLRYPPEGTTFGDAVGTAIHALCERVEAAERERDAAIANFEGLAGAFGELEQSRDEAVAAMNRANDATTRAERERDEARAVLRARRAIR